MGKTTAKLVYAIRDGVPVHISEVLSGRAARCQCPGCGKSLVARKGSIKVHHFGHDVADSCSFETALHDLGKRLLERRIQAAIDNRVPLPIQWKCDLCGDVHEGDLLKRGCKVELERAFGEARPDLLVSDADDKPVVALEVVVTHHPEEKSLSIYKMAKVEVFTFELEGEGSQIALADHTPLTATSGTCCKRPKCPGCGGFFRYASVNIVAAPCWNCGKEIRIAWKYPQGNGWGGPEHFNDQEIIFARLAGCAFTRGYSRRHKEKYLANQCPHCRSFIGRGYLHEYKGYRDVVSVLGRDAYCEMCERFAPGFLTKLKELVIRQRSVEKTLTRQGG